MLGDVGLGEIALGEFGGAAAVTPGFPVDGGYAIVADFQNSIMKVTAEEVIAKAKDSQTLIMS